MTKEKVAMEPVRKKSLYLKISDSIYSYIQVNGLQPGEKLPSEREMSAMLETSRNSVREGLRILEDRGLIEVKTGKGVFVKNPYGDQGTMTIRLQNCKVWELQELQSCLDHKAVSDAIRKASDAEKEELILISTEMLKLAECGEYSHVLDHSFHSKLYKSAHNTAVEQLLVRIREERFVQQEDLGSNSNKIWLATVGQHFSLAKAIQECDRAEAVRAINEINEYGFGIVNSILDEKRNRGKQTL